MNTEEMQKQIESTMPTPEQIVEHLDRKIEEAKRLYKTANSDQKYILESLFPQLSESEDDGIRKSIIKMISDIDGGFPFEKYGILKKDALAWLEKQCDKDKLIQELGEYKVKYTQEVLEKYIKSMDNKEDEMIKKSLINYVYCHGDAGDFTKKEFIAWLEKQGQKETAWSEEDEENMNNVLYILNQLKDTSSYEEDNTAEKTIKWFKSLKDRLCSKQ